MAYCFFVAVGSFLVSLISAQEQYVLAGTDICFDSLYYSDDHFKAPYDGEIIGAQFVHKSGNVTCNTNSRPNPKDWSLWGCTAYDARFFIELVQTGGNTLYPTLTTDGLIIADYKGLGCTPTEVTWVCSVQYYQLDGGRSGNDVTFEMRDSTNLYTVYTTDRFSLQYGEGCCDVARPDNSGGGCADIYFIYTNIFTDEPTDEPSSDPTMAPTDATPSPSTSPTRNPSPSPSVQPSQSPSQNPSLGPSESPSENPTTSPLTMSPTDEPTTSPTVERVSVTATANPTADQRESVTTASPTVDPTVDGEVEDPESGSGGLLNGVVDEDQELFVFIAAGALLLGVIVIVAVGCFCYFKRRKMHSQVTNMGYDDWA